MWNVQLENRENLYARRRRRKRRQKQMRNGEAKISFNFSLEFRFGFLVNGACYQPAALRSADHFVALRNLLSEGFFSLSPCLWREAKLIFMLLTRKADIITHASTFSRTIIDNGRELLTALTD